MESTLLAHSDKKLKEVNVRFSTQLKLKAKKEWINNYLDFDNYLKRNEEIYNEKDEKIRGEKIEKLYSDFKNEIKGFNEFFLQKEDYILKKFEEIALLFKKLNSAKKLKKVTIEDSVYQSSVIMLSEKIHILKDYSKLNSIVKIFFFHF
jgi:hypothetical protein